MTLDEEGHRATELLAGRTVSTVIRHQPTQLLIQFEDGTRLFVDISEAGLELSITGTPEDDA